LRRSRRGGVDLFAGPIPGKRDAILTSHLPDRRLVLRGLAAVATAASTPAAADAPLPAFVALGDWGREGGRAQTDVATAMARAAAEVAGRLVISAGDNFYPAGVSSVDDPQWKTSFEDVYAAASLQVPWYAALGNHDYRGHPGAQVAYSRGHSRWRMPDRYYVVMGAETGIPDLDLFVVDTTPLVGDYDEALLRLVRGRVAMPAPDPQLAWLKRALQASRADWKIVVGHHPIRSGGHHGGSAALVADLEPLLAAHGVQAYICGHDHVLQHIRRGGLDHVCTGAGASAGHVSDVDGTLFRYGAPGFALFTVEPGALRLAFRDAGGRTLYEGAIPKRRA
jgi:tartrate-resistant acid phosphatase type 5